MQTGSTSIVNLSEVLLSGPAANAISPLQSADLAGIELVWDEARRLVGLVKNYSRATTAAKTLCGIRLRSLREYYFGKRNPNGGRPKLRASFGEFKSWDEMLMNRIGIPDRMAKTWMQMADAVEAIALAEGTDIQSICEKLPHDWTPEEVNFLDKTVQRLTQDKTQLELLQTDFLSCLGYEAPERINGSNNQLGVNGGKKQPASSPQEKVESRRSLARAMLFGHDSLDHRPKPGSPAFWLNSLVASHLKGELAKHPLASLSKKELQDLRDLLFKPTMDAVNELCG